MRAPTARLVSATNSVDGKCSGASLRGADECARPYVSIYFGISSATVNWSAFRNSGKQPRPGGDHEQGSNSSEDDSGNRAEPLRSQSRLELAEFVRDSNEEHVDGIDAAAHLVGGRDLNQRCADDDADHVAGAQQEQRRQRQDQAVRDPEDDGQHAECSDGTTAWSTPARRRIGRAPPRLPSARRRLRERCAAGRVPTDRYAGFLSHRSGSSATAPPSSTANMSSEIEPRISFFSQMKRKPASTVRKLVGSRSAGSVPGEAG